MIEHLQGPQSMARSLATYIDCPHRIKREVDATFDTIMSTAQIAEYRASYLRKQKRMREAAREPIDYAQMDRDNHYARRMEVASNNLAEAINALGGHVR